mmetsp:Transcript_37810/g.82870  ORF Transcript_37810/g.82870 Transcript_37810/m.82870 type:complete len:310 (-) Transcript_37810:135-1064(-)
MRLAAASLILLAGSATAFVPSASDVRPRSPTSLASTLEYDAIIGSGSAVSADDFNSKLSANREKMAAKDKTSKSLGKDDLKVVHEDDQIVVVDKPAGVLSTPGKDGNPSLQQAVFDAFGCESGNANKMACHRLGMDTSGLMIFAKTDAALRDLNAQFRTRKVTRKYEALVKGHVADDSGVIDQPLMMDYENPPYMCISTEEKQRALIGLSADDVGKKVLENPKNSITEYEVIEREEKDGEPVTRLSLTSVTGRTHQLNVHCVAFGHPIVGDSVYGDAGEGESMCVHAKSLSFRHPGTREQVSLESAAPF